MLIDVEAIPGKGHLSDVQLDNFGECNDKWRKFFATMHLQPETQVGRRLWENGVEGVDDLPYEEYAALFATYLQNGRQVGRQDGHSEGSHKAAVLSVKTARETQEKREPREKVDRGRRREFTQVWCVNCQALGHYADD